FWRCAMVAAISAVATPVTATIANASGESVYRILLRAIMYTPAVTIVAACMSADTGVGPAIASGSQVNNGIWALFPIAPIKSSIAIQVIIGWPSCKAAAGKTS